MSESGREVLPNVQEWRPPDVRETSRISKSVRMDPGCPGVVGKTSWMSGRPFRMSRRPSRMSGRSQKTISNV